jgi:hypothetical protein
MPFTARQFAVAGVLITTAIATPAAALAGSNPAHKTPTTPGRSTAARAAAKPKPRGGTISRAAVAARLATRLGVSTSAAEHALQQLDRNATESQLRAIAHELGVSPARLRTALVEVKMSFAPRGSGVAKPGHGPSLTTLPAAAAALASRLGVSMSAAQHAMHQLGVISAREGGVDPNSPQFRAIARGLGVSTARLNSALRMVKESFAGR